jgi:hypothetical protein
LGWCLGKSPGSVPRAWGIGLPAAPHLPEVGSPPHAWGILLEFIEFVELVEFIWFGPTCVGSRVQGLG